MCGASWLFAVQTSSASERLTKEKEEDEEEEEEEEEELLWPKTSL